MSGDTVNVIEVEVEVVRAGTWILLDGRDCVCRICRDVDGVARWVSLRWSASSEKRIRLIDRFTTKNRYVNRRQLTVFAITIYAA